MVQTRINVQAIKGPFQDVSKNKGGRASSESYLPSQQQASSKNKYGAWGPVYKSKQNFVDMHIC